ncbi:MAG: hypothetical protein HEQ23_12315 [Tepidisphaera sp.]
MRAYVSILDWPQSMTADRRVEAIVAATGLDPHTARQRAARGAPQVTMLVDAELAPAIVAGLTAEGLPAFAPTEDDLLRAPAPLRVKRLIKPEGTPLAMYMAEMWKGPSEGFRCEDVELIIRARVDETTVRTVLGSEPAAHGLSGPGMMSHRSRAFISAAFDAESPGLEARKTITHESRHVIDLFTRDGRRLRCDSAKFNYDVLGPDRGISDLQSSERLALRLAEECENAQIETGFREFRCAGDIIASTERALGGVTVAKRDESPVFEFYSAWSYCRLRTMQ